MQLEPRQQSMLQALRRAGRLSRWELHDRTGIRPNTVGADMAVLLEAQVVRECEAEAEGRGRPRVPLEIDTSLRDVIGMAIRPGRVDVTKLNLMGHAVDETQTRQTEPKNIASVASELLQSMLDKRVLNIGLSTPGFVDPARHAILFSSSMPEQQVSLQPIYDVASQLPVALENDMHALASRWLLTHEQDQDEDVLLVYFDDGQLGAAILINGRPNRGCVIGGSELGHTRLPVETDECYCGHTGCLERITSSAFLKQIDGREIPLAARIADFDGTDPALEHMVELFATGVANAITFTRPNRVVMISELTRHNQFANHMVEAIRNQVMGMIAQRVRFDLWDQPATNPAETAGYLALASFYYQGWDQPAPKGNA